MDLRNTNRRIKAIELLCELNGISEDILTEYISTGNIPKKTPKEAKSVKKDK